MTQRGRYTLAVLSTGKEWSPVQLQKMFFLLDKKLGDPWWNFVPYDYGPFDPSVYREVEQLERDGLARITDSGVRSYALTPVGQREGELALNSMSERTRNYIRSLSQWLRSLSFAQLVAAVSRDYPEMRLSMPPGRPGVFSLRPARSQVRFEFVGVDTGTDNLTDQEVDEMLYTPPRRRE